jgi:hypothetical protein
VKVKSRVTTVKAKSKTHESRDKDETMKTETNTTRSTYEIKENTQDLEFIFHFDDSLYSIDICVNI